MEKYHKVSPKIAQTFEIIGSYFCDIYYNHLYLAAKSKKKNNDTANPTKSHLSQSITDEYKQAVVAFGYAIKKDKGHYSKAVTGMYRFYQTYSKFSAMTLNQFIDMLLGIFVPEDYYNQLDSRNRDQLLVKIVIALIDSLCIFVTRPDILPLIIDKHGNTANITMLQDHAIETLINERDKIFSMFVSANVSPEQEIVSKLKISLKDLLQSKVKLESENKVLKERNTLLESKIKELGRELLNARQRQPVITRAETVVSPSSNNTELRRNELKNNKKDKQLSNNRMNTLSSTDSSLLNNTSIKNNPSDKVNKSPVQDILANVDNTFTLSKDKRAKELGITFTNSDDSSANTDESEDDNDNTTDESEDDDSTDDSETQISNQYNSNDIIDDAEELLKKKYMQRAVPKSHK